MRTRKVLEYWEGAFSIANASHTVRESFETEELCDKWLEDKRRAAIELVIADYCSYMKNPVRIAVWANEEPRPRLKREDNTCPHCRSSNLSGKYVEIDTNLAKQECFCYDCDAEWTDVYKLDHTVMNTAPAKNPSQGPGEGEG